MAKSGTGRRVGGKDRSRASLGRSNTVAGNRGSGAAVYQDILEQIHERRAVLFLGAGSTVQCEKGDGASGLSGWGLAKEVLLELNKRYRDDLPFSDSEMPGLMEAAEYYQSVHPAQRIGLDSFVQQRLRGLQPTLGHYIATTLPWKAVITTNYNTVAEDAWKEAANHRFGAREALVIKADHEITDHAGETTKMRIYKPHGCVDLQAKPAERMVLTSQDYAVSEVIRKDIYRDIHALASSSTTVFVGYSLADYTFRNMYYRLTYAQGAWKHRCFSTMPIRNDRLFEWKSRSMEDLNTTLLNTTFDVFMLRLAAARGHLHTELKRRTKQNWTKLTQKNRNYIGDLRLEHVMSLKDSTD